MGVGLSGLGEFLKELGYGVPLIYAAITYGLFAWLDSSISNEARSALASIIKLRTFSNYDVSSAVVEIFDRLYTHPLLTWKALKRSSTITLIVTIAFLIEVVGIQQTFDAFDSAEWRPLLLAATASFIVTVLVDYVALFFVRDWLTLSFVSPVFSLLCGLSMGLIVALGGVLVRAVAISPISPTGYPTGLQYGWQVLLIFTIPALLVFAWLPLFALGIGLVRTVSPLSRLIGKAQWLLKDGTEHPLKSVGYVAAIAVFVISVGSRRFFGS